MMNWLKALFCRKARGAPSPNRRWKRPTGRRPFRNPTATGLMVVEEFLREVEYQSHTSHCNVIIYESWSKWFRNKEWRDAALKALEGCPFIKPGSAVFNGPCYLDSEWVFTAYITDKKPIENYRLSESMP